MKSKEFYSLEVLADILSESKRTLESWVSKGLLTPEICPTTGKKVFHYSQVAHREEIRSLFESTWDRELEVKPLKAFNSVELFAGAGGLAIGMHQAGFNNLLLSELDKHACNTLRSNMPNWNVVEGDVSHLSFSTVSKEVDLLTGGFPCQAFSYAGKQRGFEDTRGTLFFEFARAVKELSPKVFLAENVRGLLNHDEGRTLQTIRNTIASLGYTLVEPKVLKALFYKVPQKRERLILVAIRNDLADKVEFKWPSPYKSILTLKDAFFKGELYKSNVAESPGQVYPQRKKEIMEHVPQGGYWRNLSDDLQKEYMKASYFLGGGKTGMARRLSLDEPSLTLTTSPAQKQTERCHPLETRPLQIREYARIQTFPDDWEFKGPMSAIYKQIGNAVPINMAAALGRSMVRLLNDIEKIHGREFEAK